MAHATSVEAADETLIILCLLACLRSSSQNYAAHYFKCCWAYWSVYCYHGCSILWLG